METLNDLKLIQAGWVYDINFTATLKRIKERRFLEMLTDLLPDTPQIRQVKRKLLACVNERMACNE